MVRTMLQQFGLLRILGLMTLALLAPAAQAQSYDVARIEVSGAVRIDRATVLRAADLPVGGVVDAGRIDAARRALEDSGLFSSVEIRPEGDRLSILLVENPTVNVIAFEGNKRLSDEVLTGIVTSAPRRVYNTAAAEADAAQIVEAYRTQGRLSATVRPRLIERSDNRVDLVFEITEGRPVEIERLSFVGNRGFSDRRLRRVLETKQAGLFRQVIRSDTLIEDRLILDRRLLTDFYRSRGYPDMEVLSVTTELDRNRAGFLLTFTLREGPQFRIGAVDVASDLPGLDVTPYREALMLRPGVLWSPALIERDIARLERLAVQQGRDFLRVTPRTGRNDATQTLDITFEVERGPRVFVERIDIEGNTTTLDRVIRRQFDVAEGDPFNPREIRQTAERIRAMGYFTEAEVTTRPGTAPDQVIVDVDVTERPTGSIGFGANYSTDDGLGGTISFSEGNFLGRGQALSFDVTATADTASFGFDFTEPALLGRDVSLNFGAFYREANNSYADYSTRRAAILPRLSFPLTEDLRLSVSGGVTYSEIHSVDTGTADDPATPEDETTNGSSDILRKEADLGGIYAVELGYALSYDSRVRALDPTLSYLLRFEQTVGLRDDGNFLRSEVLARVRKSVLNEEVNLRAEFEGGVIGFDGGSSSRLIDRYTLSGRMRGFEPNGLGPRDLNVDNEDALGGNMFAVARFETDFPLGLPEEYGISGGLFYDIGTVWGLDNVNGGPDGSAAVDDSLNLRSSAGVSVFWDTALGPLRFNFSRALQKEDYDKERNFEFTISTRF